MDGAPGGGNAAPLDSEMRGGWMSMPRPHESASVAGHDAPLIGERAAARGPSATEGGDEHTGVKSVY